MNSAALLVELFTEELPPRALRELGEAFGAGVQDGLVRLQLADNDPRAKQVFATPRRLAVLIQNVRSKAPERFESRKLMPAKVAFGADGKPSPALVKRLEKEGAVLDQLERKLEQSAEYVFFNRTIPGGALAAGLQIALQEAIAKLPIPKVMSYQLADGVSTVHFVRPAHELLALHGDRVVEVSVLGLKAGRVTHGHRFQGARDIPVATADAYEGALAAHGKLIASFDKRRAQIDAQLRAKSDELGVSLGPENDYAPLLEEVTALVEYPSVYAGEFEAAFLEVPQECLILTMRRNQKYFPLFLSDSRLTNRFLIVSNMDLADSKNVVQGNQRVVRPRLADARFFFETDKKTRLEARIPQLAAIVYQNKLGTQLDRVERVRSLAGIVARAIGADPALAERAAWLAKGDLVTSMVGEFPELQGTMGRYYALADGEDRRVAEAIETHYRPRFAGDSLPQDSTAVALALADKMELLAGMFGIGRQPTGDKDPFALRRHALGVVRILIESGLSVSVKFLVDTAFEVFPQGILGDGRAELLAFIFERLRGHLRESAYSANEIESVLCLRPEHLEKLPRQLAAVRAFCSLPEAQSLAAANKRVANILKQAESRGEGFGAAQAGNFTEAAERSLHAALAKASLDAESLFLQGDYTGYLKTFAVLKTPVDAFFDTVMVMVEDPAIRRNRLALLADLRREMNRIADISKLAT